MPIGCVVFIMLRNVQVATCPNCGNRATVYTIKSKRGELHGIGCTEHYCNVSLPIGNMNFSNALYLWNHGLNLEKRDGTTYYVDGSKHRRMMAMEVDA